MQLRLHWVWFEVEPRTVLEDGLALSTSTRANLAISGNGSRSCWPLNRRIPLTRYRKRSMPSLPTLGNEPGPMDRAHCTLLSPPQLGSFEEVAATIQRDPAACSQLKHSMLESFGNVDYPGLY